MAFTVRLFNVTKRLNSTAQPSSEQVEYSEEFMCTLRQPCGILNPTISLEFAPGLNPSSYNYAYIPGFGRYYWINEWTADGRLWVASMSVDVLGTWQYYIGLERQYVLRSSYTQDSRIPDTLYPTKAKPTFSSEYQSFESWNYSFSSGSYVVGIVNDSTSGVGAATYYGFTNAQFRSFMNALLSDVDWLNPGGLSITEIGNGLLKALFNPMQYVSSCIWLPFAVTGTAVSTIPVGWNWNISASAVRLSGSMLYGEFMSFSIPKHPDASVYSYMNSAPFSQYTLIAPPFGTFPLDASLLIASGVLDISVDVDAVTGVGRMQVNPADGNRIIDTCAQVGCPIQLSQTTLNLNRGSSAITGAAGVISSGSMVGKIASGLSGIASALDFATNPQFMSSGNNGSIAGIGPFGLTATFYSQSGKSNSLLGSPLCRTATISDIPGYILCESAHVSIPCMDSEREQIEGFMNSGFFYEE